MGRIPVRRNLLMMHIYVNVVVRTLDVESLSVVVAWSKIGRLEFRNFQFSRSKCKVVEITTVPYDHNPLSLNSLWSSVIVLNARQLSIAGGSI